MADEHRVEAENDSQPATTDRTSKTSSTSSGVSRRSFMQTLGVSAAAGAIVDRAADANDRQDAAETERADRVPISGPEPVEITLTVNGKPMRSRVDPATTLLEALRWELQLTGSKEVCDRGACGGCSVLVDGKLIASCMMLAVDAVDSQVTTIEGLSEGDDALDPLQEAFIRHDALQCGYCTPGLLMASKALLDQHEKPTIEQIRKGLSGNICRCGTYPNIFNAILDATGQEPIVDQNAPRGATR